MTEKRRSLLRFFFRIVVLVSFVSLLVQDLMAQEESCQASLSRFARLIASTSPAQGLITGFAGTPLDVQLDSNPIGDNSIEEFSSPQWKIAGDLNQIDFFYESSPVLLSVRSANSQTGFNINIELPRRETGEWMDMNLLGPFFEHIHLKTQANEAYRITIQDPTLVKKLNDRLEEILREMKFYGHAAQAEPEAVANPMGDYYSYDPNSESAFPVLDELNAREFFASLREEGFLQQSLLEEFSKMELYKVLSASPFLGWKIEIDIEGFSLYSKLKKDGVDFEETGLRPYVFKYIVRLSPENY